MTQVHDEAERQRALDHAYRFLGRRDRTVVEVREHLEGRDVEARIVEETVEALLDQGYLDDARYARRFVEDRRNLDAWGVERIARRLAAAGVAPAEIASALERPAEDELEAAVALLRRRLTGPPADDRERERALGLLVRRGYELELAYDAVRALERQATAG